MLPQIRTEFRNFAYLRSAMVMHQLENSMVVALLLGLRQRRERRELAVRPSSSCSSSIRLDVLFDADPTSRSSSRWAARTAPWSEGTSRLAQEVGSSRAPHLSLSLTLDVQEG